MKTSLLQTFNNIYTVARSENLFQWQFLFCWTQLRPR